MPLSHTLLGIFVVIQFHNGTIVYSFSENLGMVITEVDFFITDDITFFITEDECCIQISRSFSLPVGKTPA